MNYQIPLKPTLLERIPYRLIGLSIILLSDSPMRSLVAYFGVYWNVGVMFMVNAHENIVNKTP